MAPQGTQDENKQSKNNTIYVGLHYAQTNTTEINKTWALLQTLEGREELNIVLWGNRNGPQKADT
jgi:hypothetical protein